MLLAFRHALEIVSAWALPLLIAGIPLAALARGVKVYPAFLEGAKQGFETAVRVIPPLVAVIVALGMLKASGAMDAFARAISPVTEAASLPPVWWGWRFPASPSMRRNSNLSFPAPGVLGSMTPITSKKGSITPSPTPVGRLGATLRSSWPNWLEVPSRLSTLSPTAFLSTALSKPTS